MNDYEQITPEEVCNLLDTCLDLNCDYCNSKICHGGEKAYKAREIAKRAVMNHKCSFPNGITIRPDGIHELDPCKYEEIEKYSNVTVTILKCKVCGHIEIEWQK